LITIVFGIALGLLGALRPGWIDTSSLVVSTVLVASPSFVAALVLITFFAVDLGWFPALGGGSGFLDQIRHLTLPAVALATSSLALVARITRAAVREELQREHVQTAISRGIPRAQILRRHVLRNAAIPITTVGGVTIASLIAIVAVVEQAFNLNGIGAYLVNAAASKDFAVVQIISLILITAFIVTSTAVDLLYALLDPRLQVGTHAT
jgi:peptide/nickel transport system permease protein